MTWQEWFCLVFAGVPAAMAMFAVVAVGVVRMAEAVAARRHGSEPP